MNKIFLISILMVGLFLNGVTALSCMSSFNCPGAGEENCRAEDGKYWTESYSCNSGVCEKEILRVVDCCPMSRGCTTDQICQTPSYTCVGGGAESPVDPTVKIESDSQSYTFLWLTIIFVLIIIIIALRIRYKNKNNERIE